MFVRLSSFFTPRNNRLFLFELKLICTKCRENYVKSVKQNSEKNLLSLFAAERNLLTPVFEHVIADLTVHGSSQLGRWQELKLVI